VHDVHAADAADERFLVRNPRQLRQLLRSLIDQRSLINAHIDGRDRSFPTALLDLDEDEDYLLLDGSPQEASTAPPNRPTTCCASPSSNVSWCGSACTNCSVDNDGHVAFRPLPDELVHLQRREMYRLETPVTDSPQLLIPAGEAAPKRCRCGWWTSVAAAWPRRANDCAVFSLQKRYPASCRCPTALTWRSNWLSATCCRSASPMASRSSACAC
jgi:hypothetical protein